MLGLHGLTPQELTPLAPGALVRGVLPDEDACVWVGTANGLVLFRRDGGTWRGRALSTKLDVRSLFRDARGHAWATTDHGHLALVHGGVHETPPSIGPAASPSASSQPTVDAVFEDAEGTTWLGGTTGLSRVLDTDTVRFSEQDGLPAQRVMAITQSQDGFLWLAVDRGVSHVGRRAAVVRIHPSELDRAAAEHRPMADYTLYDAMNGLAGVPLGPVSAARSTDGTLWFVFGGSLTVIDPARITPARERDAARARIVGATIDDRTVTRASSGTLPAGTRKVQIDYTALGLTAPRQIHFRYRLDGFDHEWIEAGARRQAYYTNLAPGTYVFRVQANGEGATWTQPQAEWRFVVQPTFRQTNWFYALCATLLLLGMWAAVQTRTWFLNRQFAAALAERTRLSREIHDTMLQSLVGIALQVQAIARGCAPEAAEQQSQLVGLRRQVEEYIREARQAIQNLRSPMLESSGLDGAIAELGRRIVTAPVRFELSSDPIDRATAAEGELLRIAQEAMTNAARHAHATHIRVDLHQDAGTIRLRVTDDGRGFDVDASRADATGHYGLTGMHERAARAGGRLSIERSTHGTVVEAVIPRCALPKP